MPVEERKHLTEFWDEYILLKTFKCLPSQLDEEDYYRLKNFMVIDSWVDEALEQKQKQQQQLNKFRKP